MVKPEPMEVENGSTSTIYRSGKAPAGYFVSKTKAIVFLFIAVTTCIAVGVIVYVASPKPKPVPVVDPSTDPSTAGTMSTPAGGGDGTATTQMGTSLAPIKPTTTPKPTKPTDVRIPLDLRPDLYEISLQPYLEETDGDDKFKFDGSVTVHLFVSKATDMIYLHVNDLVIDEASILVSDVNNGAEVSHEESTRDPDRQFFKLQTKTPLTEGGNYTVFMKYRGNLNDQLVGFYRSSYKRTDGTTQYLATTQFQPTDARRAFPCMDEPGIKSVFTITIKCLEKYTPISNSLPNKTDTSGGFKTVTFKPTKKMSTYLVAFVVSDFKYKEKTTKNGVQVRVWAREDALKTVDYALDAGAKILGYYGDFFKEKFPLDKQDMIAIPDFNAGAMENWGLVTYRETALLYDEKKSSISNMQRVCLVVAHELAHQWFGNLVTPKWWDDLWLNEGFASFVEFLGMDINEPDLKVLQQFVTTDLQPTLVADSIASSHPIYQKVGHPDEINELFDSISYGKGASIIRMMDFFLKRENLQSGLQLYLEDFKYGNTASKDLWNKLTEAVKGTDREKDVAAVMDTWTLQMGFPVVTIKKTGTTAIARQDRFLLDGESDPSEGEFGYKWEIPLTYTTKNTKNWESNNTEIYWMPKNGTELHFKGLNVDNWIIGNIEQMGYYRVNYDIANWDKIIKQLKDNHADIDPKNRAQILDDAFNLARADLLHYETAFGLTEYLNKEESYIPWDAATNGLAFVRDILSQTSSYGNYMKYMQKIAEPHYTRLTFETIKGEDPLDTYLRSTIVGLMCGSGHKDCLDKSAKALSDWMGASPTPSPSDPNPIDLNLRSQIYCYGIKGGDAEIWHFMLKKYNQETVAAEKKRIMLSLACSKEPWIIKKLLAMSIEKKDIRKQDGASVIQAVANKDVGNPFAWDFIRSEWSYLRQAYGSSMSFARVILAVTSNFSNKWKLQELQSFMDAHPDQGSASRGFSQAVEKTNANINWIGKNLEEVGGWLKANV